MCCDFVPDVYDVYGQPCASRSRIIQGSLGTM